MNPEIYNEFEVGKIGGKEHKVQTERGTVSIDADTAKEMNSRFDKIKNEGLIYELAEKKSDDKELRANLFLEAKDLGLNVPKNIKTETLQTKINEAKA